MTMQEVGALLHRHQQKRSTLQTCMTPSGLMRCIIVTAISVTSRDDRLSERQMLVHLLFHSWSLAELPIGSFNSSDRAGERNDGSNEERLQHQIQTLEEENSSLKALSRSLMKERQELLNKTSATNVEMASLRQLCENLQLQLRSLTEGKGDAGRNPGLIQEDLLTDSKRKPLQDDAVMLGWNQQATDGGDLHALSWMAPDFDLDELL
uniref:Uncharacterized protein n=1 Tax=Guillardia theta TaxID=55529 RepID=A0A7S4PKS6_GUITH|mmetsp:Transcript_5705/g.20071  ORF Transcript_5705/g.20071 Transcript_5705/m.20071 type:complete len:208 (+) Transcript_5705:758-1381(+)